MNITFGVSFREKDVEALSKLADIEFAQDSPLRVLYQVLEQQAPVIAAAFTRLNEHKKWSMEEADQVADYMSNYCWRP